MTTLTTQQASEICLADKTAWLTLKAELAQAEQAVKAALSDYYRRQGIDPEPIVGKLEEDCDHCESCGN